MEAQMIETKDDIIDEQAAHIAKIEKLNRELLAELEKFVEAYKDAPQRLGAGSKAHQHFSKAKALIQKAKDAR